jgi:predicted membrane protein
MNSLSLNKYAQIFLGLSIILFIIFPYNIPSIVADFIGSTLGIVSIFAVSVSLFCFANTILALLFVLLAYILLQKCCKTSRNTQHIQFTPTKKIVDTHMFPAKTVTLEEQVVNMMAPLGNKEPTEFIDSSYKPMFNNLNSASLF